MSTLVKAAFILRGEKADLDRALEFLGTCADHVDVTLLYQGIVAGSASAITSTGGDVQCMLARGLLGIPVEIFVVKQHHNPEGFKLSTVGVRTRVQIKKGFTDAGRKGTLFSKPVKFGQEWVGVIWDDEEDPDWFKLDGLEAL